MLEIKEQIKFGLAFIIYIAGLFFHEKPFASVILFILTAFVLVFFEIIKEWIQK